MPDQTTELAASTPLGKLKQYLKHDDIQQRLRDMLGERAGAFTNSIINTMSGSRQLMKCDPETVMQSAMIAASVNLPIDPALGFAAIVPYKSTAQFQIMYKGVIQLCIRSGQYERIHDTEVYQDELESYNPITGEIKFRCLTEYKMRPKHDLADVVGFYVCFKLLKGFEASLYMTKEEVMAHAERYSKAYQYDLRERKQTCPWSTDPIAMGRKTVILGLLKRYGVMSVEMQDAVRQDAESEYDGAAKPVESTTIPKTAGMHAFGKKKGAEDKPETTESNAGKDAQAKDVAPESTDGDQKEVATEGQQPDPSSGDAPQYTCTKCKTSDKIEMKKTRAGTIPFCMTCVSGKKVVENK